MMIEMLEKFTIKANENQYLRNHGQTFENLFLQIIDDRMKKSIESQRNSIEKSISDKVEPFLVQDMSLDIDSCISKIDKDSIINNVLKIAIDNTLPSIPQKYPYLIDSSKSKAMDIIRSSIANSKQKIISKNAMEVYDLGNGYSIEDGSFRMKVFSLKDAPYLYEKDLGNGVHVAYRLPEYVTMDFVPTRYQHNDYKLRTSVNDFVSEMVSKISGGKGFQFSTSKLGIDRINHFAKSLLGVTFSTNSPETEMSISVNVNAIAKVSFNSDTNLKNHLVPDLRSRFDDLERSLRSYDVKSPQIQSMVSRIFQDYGESVAVRFYIGCYEIAITNNSGTRFESGGQNAFASSSCMSSGINFGSKLSLKSGRSRDNSSTNSQYSGIQNISSNGTVIACGSSSHPATFMCDIVKSPISNNESSFAPLSRFASSDSVQRALDYWSGRWNFKPKTLNEYLTCNNLSSLPTNDTIVLYKDGVPMNLTIKNGQIVLPNSEIIYTLYRIYDNNVEKNEAERLDVYIDPSDMTIDNLTKNLYVKIWKNRTGHHKRADGTETLSLKIILGPLWKFEDNITPAYFNGSAFNNSIINNPSSHFLSVDFTRPRGPEGKSYPEQMFYLQLQQKIKVKLA